MPDDDELSNENVLNSNAITDEVAAVLTNALANNSKLRELDLGYNRDVTATGWVGSRLFCAIPTQRWRYWILGAIASMIM